MTLALLVSILLSLALPLYSAVFKVTLSHAYIAGKYDIPLELIRRSSEAARPLSRIAVDTLKEKLLAEGDDMGGQLPIVVAIPNTPLLTTALFDANYVSRINFAISSF